MRISPDHERYAGVTGLGGKIGGGGSGCQGVGDVRMTESVDPDRRQFFQLSHLLCWALTPVRVNFHDKAKPPIVVILQQEALFLQSLFFVLQHKVCASSLQLLLINAKGDMFRPASLYAY